MWFVGTYSFRATTFFSYIYHSNVFNKNKNHMIITNTETVPGKQIVETLGIVRGSTVRARNVGRDITAGLKSIFGGEIDEYTNLLARSREDAMKRMVEDAMRLGADAIVNVRFNTSAVMQGAAEILAYGTAVKLSSGKSLGETFQDRQN